MNICEVNTMHICSDILSVRILMEYKNHAKFGRHIPLKKDLSNSSKSAAQPEK